MKSRLAITTTVMVGMALGGPALSVAAPTGTVPAAQGAASAQYGKTDGGQAATTLLPSAAAPALHSADVPQIEVAGSVQEESGDVRRRPTSQRSGPEVRAAEQVAAVSGPGRLPFTGLAAIPLLLTGLGLLGGGLALRRGRN